MQTKKELAQQIETALAMAEKAEQACWDAATDAKKWRTELTRLKAQYKAAKVAQ